MQAREWITRQVMAHGEMTSMRLQSTFTTIVRFIPTTVPTTPDFMILSMGQDTGMGTGTDILTATDTDMATITPGDGTLVSASDGATGIEVMPIIHITTEADMAMDTADTVMAVTTVGNIGTQEMWPIVTAEEIRTLVTTAT